MSSFVTAAVRSVGGKITRSGLETRRSRPPASTVVASDLATSGSSTGHDREPPDTRPARAATTTPPAPSIASKTWREAAPPVRDIKDSGRITDNPVGVRTFRNEDRLTDLRRRTDERNAPAREPGRRRAPADLRPLARPL